jgi:hypothetical protein
MGELGFLVIAGLVPAIHVLAGIRVDKKTWMPETSSAKMRFAPPWSLYVRCWAERKTYALIELFSFLVESRCGAVALGRAYLLPVASDLLKRRARALLLERASAALLRL